MQNIIHNKLLNLTGDIMETIKMTNEQITNTMITYVNGQAIPNPVQESLKKKKVPAKVQYWIRRALDEVKQDYKILEETRQELVQQYSRKDEDENPLIIMQDFRKIKELFDEQKTIEEIQESDLEAAIAGEFISIKIAKKIAKWSEGKINAESDGNISIKDVIEFQKAMNDLMMVEVDLGIPMIKTDFDAWDNNPNIDVLDGAEMDLLLPMIKVE